MLRHFGSCTQRPTDFAGTVFNPPISKRYAELKIIRKVKLVRRKKLLK
jgi:hypothetical protein